MSNIIKLLCLSTILIGCQGAYENKGSNSSYSKENLAKKSTAPDQAINRQVQDISRNTANTAAQVNQAKTNALKP